MYLMETIEIKDQKISDKMPSILELVSISILYLLQIFLLLRRVGLFQYPQTQPQGHPNKGLRTLNPDYFFYPFVLSVTEVLTRP